MDLRTWALDYGLLLDFNEASFVEQMVHNQHRLFGYVVTLVPNRDDAEEVFQEACLTLWNAR